MDFYFFFNSILLGVGLAMDAFSVSLANGLTEPDMNKPRHCAMAFVYAIFQFAMPMIGWICAHTIAERFEGIKPVIPWIALILLLYIGIKMLIDAHKAKGATDNDVAARGRIGTQTLILQGIATSIDALSVGVAYADYTAGMAFLSSLIIAIVTFIICFIGISIGKRFGTRFSGKAGVLGGCILIFIGLEIFVRGVIL